MKSACWFREIGFQVVEGRSSRSPCPIHELLYGGSGRSQGRKFCITVVRGGMISRKQSSKTAISRKCGRCTCVGTRKERIAMHANYWRGYASTWGTTGRETSTFYARKTGNRERRERCSRFGLGNRSRLPRAQGGRLLSWALAASPVRHAIPRCSRVAGPTGRQNRGRLTHREPATWRRRREDVCPNRPLNSTRASRESRLRARPCNPGDRQRFLAPGRFI